MSQQQPTRLSIPHATIGYSRGASSPATGRADIDDNNHGDGIPDNKNSGNGNGNGNHTCNQSISVTQDPGQSQSCSSPTSSTDSSFQNPSTNNGDGDVTRGRTRAYGQTHDQGNGHSLNQGRGGDTPFSPVGTVSNTNGFETPMITSPNVSNKAMHGSVFSMHLPFPRGMKHEQVGKNGWEEVMQKINAPTSSTREKEVIGAETIPEIDLDVHSAEAEEQETASEDKVDLQQNQIPQIKVDAEPKAEAASAIDPRLKSKKREQSQQKKEKPTVHNDRIIAIDFDDVCSQNMAAIYKAHNEKYGTDLTLDDLQTYVFWQNKGWGTPAEVVRKTMILNHLLPRTAPIPGFSDALRTLHAPGHKIHIITSRPSSDREGMIAWLAREGITVGTKEGDIIEAAWFTGTDSDVEIDVGDKGDEAFERELNARLKELWRDGVGKGKGGLGKLKILRQINASLFIDDHYGNLQPILDADTPIPCLLFGEYGWNKSQSGITSPAEMMDYNERIEAGLPLPLKEIQFAKQSALDNANGSEHEGTGGRGFAEGLFRVSKWDEVVEWVKEWDRQAAKSVCLDT